MLNRVKDWVWGPPLGWGAVTRLDLLLALVLSAVAEVIVSGVGPRPIRKGESLPASRCC
jgi:hypothetical protein